MKAAVEEAQRRWPEFVAAFARRAPEQTFGVKVPITDGKTTEFIWVSVTSLEDDRICGKIDNDPVDLTNVKHGSRVRVKQRKLNDWAYMVGDEMIGGFTVKVLQDLQRRADE
jgi:uncharacterized protein YegJ (DUF2314 family)